MDLGNGSEASSAMVRQGQRPKYQQELIDEFMDCHKSQQMSQFCHRLLNSSPVPYAPSITPLDELRPIYIKDLRLETQHRGNYLLLRALTTPKRMIAIMAIVEDENADALMLQLYQQPDEKLRPATDVIMTNDMFLIKEPYFIQMLNGGYGIRVDHVSDLVCLDADHDILPEQWKSQHSCKTASNWKQEGEAAMEMYSYWTAIQSYTAALKCLSSAHNMEDIHLNRAFAHLKHGSFDAALDDTRYMISRLDSSEYALYLAGKALYGLERFSECCKIFERLCNKHPQHSSAATELERARRRLAEQRSGKYDFRAIYEYISKARPPHLDCATFIGPVVVKPSPGRGQGLFTTRAIKAGELLLCEKAFAYCNAGTLQESGLSHLTTTIIQKLWENPSLVPKFTALQDGTHGSVERTEIDGKLVIDTFLVARIVSSNVFASLTSSYDTKAFSTSDSPRELYYGIWLMATKINHSCLCNAHRSFIGDLQFVHATCHIPRDTELTFWYKSPTKASDDMENKLEVWGFRCNCLICLDSDETTKKQLQGREKLLEDVKAILTTRTADTAEAERLLVAIDGSYKYPASEVPRLALRIPYLSLANSYLKHGVMAKAVSMTLKSLESAGFVIKNANLCTPPSKPFRVEKLGLVMDEVLDAWLLLYKIYTDKESYLAPHAKHYAKMTHKILYGEIYTFKGTGR